MGPFRRMGLRFFEAGDSRAATLGGMKADPERKGRLRPLPSPFGADAPDAELVRAIAEGNKAALHAAWNRYVGAVRGTLRACLGDDAAVEDLVQEVFLGLYRSAGRIRDPLALRPYLTGAAANAASLELRSRGRRRRWYRLFHWWLGEPIGSPNVDQRDALRSLRDLLARIPAREREAFVLRYAQDLTPGEVAQALRIPLGTAKRAIAEGRRRVLLRAQNEPALREYLRQERL
jgi:RNA polymerase sigma-70 factor, ECF subfamily